MFSWVPIGTLLLYNYHLEKSIIKCILILGIISVIFNLIAIPAAAAAVLAGIFCRLAKEKKKTRQDGSLSPRRGMGRISDGSMESRETRSHRQIAHLREQLRYYLK